MRKIIPVFLAFSLFSSAVAQAAPAIDAAGAGALEKQVNADLLWRVNMTKIFGQGLSADGKATVTPKKDFYEVHLPHLALVANAQGKLEIGALVIDVAPATEPGAWLIKEAPLPPSMTFYDTKNAPVAHLIIAGDQHFAATWLPGQGIYPKIDSFFEKVEITGENKNTATLKIAALKSSINLKSNGDGTWSGPVDFDATGVTVGIPGPDPVTLDIGKVSASNLYDRLDLSQSVRIKEMAEDSVKNGLPQTDEEKKAFVGRLMTQTPISADGLSATLDISKAVIHDTGSAQQPQREASLDHLVFSGLSTNLKQDKGKLLLKTTFDGLHAPFVAAPLLDLVPHTLNAEVTFDNLPVSKIAELFFNIVKKQSAASGLGPVAEKLAQDNAKADASAAAAAVPGLLQNAGASVSVYNSYAKSNAVSTSIEGKLNATPGAALNVTGKMTVVLKGFDEFVKKMQGTALKAGSDPHMLGYLAAFMAVDAKGAADKTVTGTSIRNFIFELQKDGSILLNGAPFAAQSTPVKPAAH